MSNIIKLGQIINDYLIISEIGKGNFSTVYLAYNFVTKDDIKFFAIKILNKENTNNIENEQKIIRLITKNKLDNCVGFIKMFTYKKQLCIVQQLMFCTLLDLIPLIHSYNIDNIEHTTKLYNDMKSGILAIHKFNIMHSDIKPENIFINITKNKHIFNTNLFLNSDIKKFKKLIDNKTTYNKQSIKKIFNEFSNKYKQGLDNTNESNTEIDYLNLEEFEEDDSIYTESDIESLHENSDDIDVQLTFLVNDIKENNNKEELKDNTIELFKKFIKKNYSDNINNFLNHINYYLGDFGNSFILDEPTDQYIDFQTRYYRAPEIILRGEQTLKSDYWALGCVLYEFINNKILFNPIKSHGCSCDQEHLMQILEFEKQINNKVIVTNNITKFRKFYLFFQIENNKIFFCKELDNTLKKYNFNIQKINYFLNIIKSTLEFDHNLRKL